MPLRCCLSTLPSSVWSPLVHFPCFEDICHGCKHCGQTWGPVEERTVHSFFFVFFLRVNKAFLDTIAAEFASCLIRTKSQAHPREITGKRSWKGEGGREEHWNENQGIVSTEEGKMPIWLVYYGPLCPLCVCVCVCVCVHLLVMPESLRPHRL